MNPSYFMFCLLNFLPVNKIHLVLSVAIGVRKHVAHTLLKMLCQHVNCNHNSVKKPALTKA